MMITVESSEEQSGSKVLNVHSAAIHIENKVTLIQRNSWLYLLYRAFPTLKEQTVHEMPLSDLKEYLQLSKKDNSPIKQSLKGLVGTVLEWNIFEKDQEEWGATSLLAYCKIVTKGGVSMLTYEFSSEIRRKLANPSMYVKINLLISQKFKSKHSLSLYCLALDYLRVKDNYGYKDFSLNEIKKYLGIEDKNYSTKELKRSVLMPAKREINKTSDIELQISDTTRGRKILGFRIEMRLKENFSPNDKSPGGVGVFPIHLDAPAYSFPDSVQKFHEKHGVETNAKHFKNAVESARSALGDDFGAYLSHVVETAKKKESFGIKNMAGFYISQINEDALIFAFKQRQSEAQVRKQIVEQKHQEVLERELQKIYQAVDRKAFVSFLLEQIPEIESTAKALIEEHSNTMVKQIFTTKFREKVTKEAIESPAIAVLLYNFSTVFGYTALNYQEWRAQYTEDPKNAPALDRMMYIVNEELKRA